MVPQKNSVLIPEITSVPWPSYGSTKASFTVFTQKEGSNRRQFAGTSLNLELALIISIAINRIAELWRVLG